MNMSKVITYYTETHIDGQMVPYPAQHQVPQPQSGSHRPLQSRCIPGTWYTYMAALLGAVCSTLDDRAGERSAVRGKQESDWSGRTPRPNSPNSSLTTTTPGGLKRFYDTIIVAVWNGGGV